MHQGLLFVLSQPATVSLEEFHDWYDHEHAPARLAFDGIAHGTRYRAVDDERPEWLATYDVDLAVLDTSDYKALRDHRSVREQQVIAGLSTFERRTYELVDETPPTNGPPGPLVVCVSLELSAEKEYHDWYAEEHIPMLHHIAGWSRTRRFRLLDGDAPRLLAVHDIAGPEVFDESAYHEAVSTSRRDALMEQVTRRERRVFKVHRRFD